MSNMARDLGKHFRDRIATVVEDSLDTMHRGRVSQEEAMSAVLGHLLGMAAVVAIEHGISEEDFAHGCMDIYDRLKKARPHD